MAYSHGQQDRISLTLPASPWLAWLLICLCRQVERQRWLCQMAKDLNAEQGELPGRPDWQYEFHGSGLCLTGPNQEMIDFDFHDCEGVSVDPYFFARRVVTLAHKPFAEARLLRWLGGVELIVDTLGELLSAGWIEYIPGSQHVFRLTERVPQREVAAADFISTQVQEYWCELFGEEQAEPAHRKFLLSRLEDGKKAGRVVAEVASLLPSDLARAACARLIEADSALGEAVECLDRLDGEASPAMQRLAARLDPRSHHPYVACATARYLLVRGQQQGLELLWSFGAVKVVPGYHGNPMLDQLALLALEFAPQRALPLLRLGLRSSTPAVVMNLAVVLALLRRPWCERELRAALDEPRGEPTCKRYLAAALGVAGPPLPRREPGQVGYSFDEVTAHSLPRWLADGGEKMRPLAERLAGGLADL